MAIRSPKKQGGFLSIDGVFWLMLIAVALGFILVIAWSMLGNSDTAIEQSNISTMVASTKKLKGSGGYGTSGANMVPSLIKLEGIGTMGKNGNTLVNQWNGAVTVVSNGMTFTITETNLPASACIVLATKVAKDQKTTTSINGGSATAGEILGTTASTSCSGDTNTIAWTFF